MYVPMARAPSSFWTFVLTRSMSPASFIRWKIVHVAFTRFCVWSTTGALVDISLICPSQVPPTITLGSVTR